MRTSIATDGERTAPGRGAGQIAAFSTIMLVPETSRWESGAVSSGLRGQLAHTPLSGQGLNLC